MWQEKLEAELRAAQVNWVYWANLAAVDVMDAVYLSLGIDPGAVRDYQSAMRSAPGGARDIPGFKARLDIARSSMFANTLSAHAIEGRRSSGWGDATGVVLTEFRTWGESLPVPFTFPDEFPKAAAPEPAALVTQGNSEPTQDDPLTTRERETLLSLIGVLAEAAGLDLRVDTRGHAEAKRIKPLAEKRRFHTTPETIAKKLVAARQLIAPKGPESMP